MRLFACLFLLAYCLAIPTGLSAQEDAAGEIGRALWAVHDLNDRGHYAEALALAEETLDRAEVTLGQEHPHTLQCVNDLAFLYQNRGRYAEAEKLFRRALEAGERVLGVDHPDTLGSVKNLAALYHIQGRYGEAELLYRRALEARERVLGPDHPDTLDSVNDWASLYVTQGRYGEAEPLFRRALEARERLLGADHPQTLISLNNLAGLYARQGRYDQAGPLLTRAMEASERMLGPEHSQTLAFINNLAFLYLKHGRYSEAEPLFRRALDACERLLGVDHPDTLRIIQNLAFLYQAQGRYGDAAPLYRRTLEARERALGPDHPDTLGSVNDLGFFYESQSLHDEAERLFRRALGARERVLGPEHPDTLGTRGNLAAVLARTGRVSEALRELRALDLYLGQWLDTEVRTTRAAVTKRQALLLGSMYQDAAFSLALAHPSEAGSVFAADLVLRWKKRLAQEDAVLNNLARESRDSALTASIAAVLRGRAALSNVAFDPDVPAAERASLREALEAAEAELRAKSAAYGRFQDVESARADEVALAIPRGSALVEYRFFSPYDFDRTRFGPARLLAVVLSPEASPALVDLGEAEPLLALQPAMTDPDLLETIEFSFESAARVGHEGLMAPLLPHLDGVETLFIAPDGPLNALPFEALSDTAGKRLFERFQVHMLQTGRDLVAHDRPVLGKGIVAVGGVDFGPLGLAGGTTNDDPCEKQKKVQVAAAESPETDNDLIRASLESTRAQIGGFCPLEQSLAEATNIAAHYDALRPDEPAPVLLTGTDATEGALKALAVPRVLHLATHGYYLESGSIDGQPLLQSGVTLAGANRALAGEVGSDGENGVLHAVEAQTLNLYGTELVVLSACDTGKGAVDYSEGLEGLPRAFYVAGAKNVLVALWPVGDLAARNFMDRFYVTWLAQPVSDPARALYETKLAHITGNAAERNPAAWAPFVLFEG